MNTPLTIKETQEGLLDKKFSVVELVDHYLQRINKYNEEYNIFLTISDEVAYKEAKEVDKKISDMGSDISNVNPLFGAITSYKDIFSTKGIRTTAASKVLESYVPEYSATVVERLQGSGAITIGKTNCDAWAHGASGENSDYGPTKNPWNKEYVPGGSSSGSAASVAGGLSLISMGSDTGGSTRQPASFCHVVGLKPTYGAIPRYGTIAMASSLDTMGPFGNSIEDVEIMFNVLKGEDGYDATVKNVEYESKDSKFKVGIPKEYFIDGLDSEVRESIDKAIEVYKSIGVEFVELSLPHTKYAVPVYYIIQPAEVSSNLGRYDGIRFGGDRNTFGAEAKRRIMLGTYVLSSGYYDAYYLQAQKVRSKLIEDFDKAFEKVDAIISPVSPTLPFKIGENSSDPLKMYLADVFTAGINLAGIPGLAIPSGFAKDNLPVGFQLLGPKFSEYNLFKLGKMYHKEIGYQPKIAL